MITSILIIKFHFILGLLMDRKNPQHAFLRKGSKAVGPMS